MTTLPFYPGPLKRDLIQRAYGMLGLSYVEHDLEPEEYVIGLRAMNDQMAVLGEATGYNFPHSGDGDPAENSGIAAEDVLGASVYVAQLLGPTIGKAFNPNRIQANAASAFLVRCQKVPVQQLGRQTIRGAGNRRYVLQSPYFYAPISPDEPNQ